ncbi:MAG: DUF86 domain-containing protein [candidate division WOR-3 bacterium]
MNEVIEARVRTFKDAVNRLKELKGEGKERFLNDWKLQDSALREFQVAIESLADIANHIIAQKDWRRPTSYKEIITVLAENKVIPEDFVKTGEKIMGFRNIIVHEYLYLDLEKVFLNLMKLEDLEKFLKHLIEQISD